MGIIKRIKKEFSTDKEAIKRYEDELEDSSDEKLDDIIYKWSDPEYEYFKAALNIKKKREEER